MSEDFLLKNLLSKTQEEYIMVRNRDYVAPENKHFTQIALDGRPITDIAYFKLHTGTIVNGLWSFAKNSKRAPGFSDSQLNIMRFIVPFLTDAFNRACIAPPVPEDLAYLDTTGHILDAGSRINEAFEDLFGHQLLVNVNSQKRILRNTFLQHYSWFIHGPLSPSIDRVTLRSEKKAYTFLFSLLHPQTIVLDPEGFPFASVRLLGTALSMNSIQQISLPHLAQRYGFTRRECEVLLGIYRGESNKVIAQTLGVDESTVKRHTHNIYEKSGFRSRLELVVGLSER
jgi:DNA-binding CsgD family transcriptional regulator